MIREMTCIRCPKGCTLKIDICDGKVMTLTGNLCPKGDVYGRQEIENPERTVTLTVASIGLELRRIPVRTSKPVPKELMNDIVKEADRLRVSEPVVCGDKLIRNILGTGADLIATRSVGVLTSR